MDYITTRTSLSPIRLGFAPGFVNDNNECTRLATASDKVYQLLVHGRWFSPGTLASSTTKTGRHDITEILLEMALNTIKQSNHEIGVVLVVIIWYLDLQLHVPMQSVAITTKIVSSNHAQTRCTSFKFM